jgi:hypothetical protein
VLLSFGSTLAPAANAAPRVASPRQPDGNGTVTVTGELQQWHKNWRPGDPTWQNGKGKGLPGALPP